MSSRVYAVIPVHNGIEHTLPTVRSLLPLMPPGSRVVVVDDGSDDRTIIDANKFGAELIVHSKNAGKGRCIREGLEYALENGCNVAITMDGDGQHDLAEIDKFLAEYRRSGADIVLGNRMHRPMNEQTATVIGYFARRSLAR